MNDPVYVPAGEVARLLHTLRQERDEALLRAATAERERDDALRDGRIERGAPLPGDLPPGWEVAAPGVYLREGGGVVREVTGGVISWFATASDGGDLDEGRLLSSAVLAISSVDAVLAGATPAERPTDFEVRTFERLLLLSDTSLRRINAWIRSVTDGEVSDWRDLTSTDRRKLRAWLSQPGDFQ